MNCQHSYQDIAVKVIAHTKLGVFRQLDFSYREGKGGKLNTPRFGKNYVTKNDVRYHPIRIIFDFQISNPLLKRIPPTKITSYMAMRRTKLEQILAPKSRSVIAACFGYSYQ